MTKVVAKVAQGRGRALFICDFSPPRGGTPEPLRSASHLEVDFISVAYNPGKSTRVNSAMAAYWIKQNAGKEVIFTLATRDMNKVAVQSLLLGAQLLDLQNVVAVKGDQFTEKDLSAVKDVSDFRTTELLGSVAAMNQGLDFKGLKLSSPTDFCAGATVDLGRDIENELRLTRRKVEAGAHFFLSQPTFSPDQPRQFEARYAELHGEKLGPPVFYGVQIVTQDSIMFSSIPQWVTRDLDRGRRPEDIALHVLHAFAGAGLKLIYLVPPILKGGRRDYEAAQAVLEAFRESP